MFFYSLGNDIWDLVTQLNHPIQLVAMIINHKKTSWNIAEKGKQVTKKNFLSLFKAVLTMFIFPVSSLLFSKSILF